MEFPLFIDIDPAPITNWLLLFMAITGVVTLLARWIKKGAEKREAHAQQERAELVQLIKDVTIQIRTDSNGGQSLFDLTNAVKRLDGKVDVLVERQETVVADVTLLKSAVIQLEDDVDGMKE